MESKRHPEVVIIGGTKTISEFFKAGLVNELYLVIEPVLFDPRLTLVNEVNGDFKLSLSSVTQLNENTVQLHYLVK